MLSISKRSQWFHLMTPTLKSIWSQFSQLAGALAEEGCSLDQIVVKATEVLKEIGE